MTVTDPELFDGTDYQIPYPDIDNQQVTGLAVRLAGNLNLDRNNPNHTQFAEALTLGRNITIDVEASVDRKAHTITDNDNGQTVTHQITLRIHTIHGLAE